MRLLTPIAITILLSACAGYGPEVSEREARLVDLAKAKAAGAGFPVLGQLPDHAPNPEDIPPELASTLRAQAAELVSLSSNLGVTSDSPTVEATVVELLALVTALREGSIRRPPVADFDSLDFPTPPPLEE